MSAAEVRPSDTAHGAAPRSGSAPRSRRAATIRLSLLVAAVAVLGLLWQALVPTDARSADAIAHALSRLGDTPGGSAAAALALALATSLLFPFSGLAVACGALFGFLHGTAIALAGAVLAAAIGYAFGAWIWREAVLSLVPARLIDWSRALARRGLLTSAALRLIPVAPFGLVNLVAGTTHIRLRDFLLGTLIGMTPGTTLLTLIGDRSLAAARDPGWQSAATIAGVIVVAIGAARLLRRTLAPTLASATRPSRCEEERNEAGRDAATADTGDCRIVCRSGGSTIERAPDARTPHAR